MLYFYIGLILLCETTAISFLKEFSQIHRSWFFVLGALFYAGVSLLLVQSFGYEGMGIINVLWSAFSVIFVAGVGVLKFHEHITHAEAVGMLFTVAGVVILRF